MSFLWQVPVKYLLLITLYLPFIILHFYPDFQWIKYNYWFNKKNWFKMINIEIVKLWRLWRRIINYNDAFNFLYYLYTKLNLNKNKSQSSLLLLNTNKSTDKSFRLFYMYNFMNRLRNSNYSEIFYSISKIFLTYIFSFLFILYSIHNI